MDRRDETGRPAVALGSENRVRSGRTDTRKRRVVEAHFAPGGWGTRRAAAATARPSPRRPGRRRSCGSRGGTTQWRGRRTTRTGRRSWNTWNWIVGRLRTGPSLSSDDRGDATAGGSADPSGRVRVVSASRGPASVLVLEEHYVAALALGRALSREEPAVVLGRARPERHVGRGEVRGSPAAATGVDGAVRPVRVVALTQDLALFCDVIGLAQWQLYILSL